MPIKSKEEKVKIKKQEEQAVKKHEAYFGKRSNWTSRNRAPVLDNSTEMKALMG